MRNAFAIIIAVFLTSCVSDVRLPHSVDSGAAESLDITDQEWREIQQLAAEEKGWVPDTVLKVGKTLVEVRFTAIGDVHGTKKGGGIARRYKKNAVHWVKTNFSGDWSYGMSG